ncbi:MAG: dephospho-CoA kinase [Erysipelothrix sp.]|nr:dephospho-CoA kinase [Erysipelothrix sp.]
MSKLSKKKIGITGTIGSGKSSVTKLISKYHKTLSADEIVAKLYQDKTIVKRVNKEILNSVSDVLNKQQLSEAIFTNKDLKIKLEQMIHPLVKAEVKNWLDTNYGLLFVEVPLLYEANFQDLFDLVIVVVADQDKIIKRLSKTRGYSVKAAKQRIENQLSVEKKLEKADICLSNNGSYQDLVEKVIELLKTLEVGD